MRKSSPVALLGLIVALAGISLPAIAGSNADPTAQQPATGMIDLDKIPVKPITGPQSVRGVEVDDEADGGLGDDTTGGVETWRHGGIHPIRGFETDEEGDSDD